MFSVKKVSFPAKTALKNDLSLLHAQIMPGMKLLNEMKRTIFNKNYNNFTGNT